MNDKKILKTAQTASMQATQATAVIITPKEQETTTPYIIKDRVHIS